MPPIETKRRTATMSISLPPELARAIAQRVEGGLYTSASELIREALRLLLKVEEAQQAQIEKRIEAAASAAPSSAALRFATTMELFDLGCALRDEKLRRRGEDGGEADLSRMEEQQEAGPGLRIAPERLEKLKLRE
jgi:putative addiction module CopG family antidote